MFDAAFLEHTQQLIGVGRVAVFKFVIRKHIFTVNDHGVFLAQVAAQLFQGSLEAGVQFFGRIEHGGVGKLKRAVCSHTYLALLHT